MANWSNISEHTCSTCKTTKSIDSFRKRNPQTHLIKNQCRPCETKQASTWNKDNKDRFNKNWNSMYHKMDKEKLEKRDISRWGNNRTPVGRYGFLKKAAKKKNVSLDITKEQHIELLKQPCHYCGYELHKSGHCLDRKNPNIGYLLSNVVPCCDVCNTTKHAHWTYEEFIQIAKTIKDIKNNRDKKGIPQPSRTWMKGRVSNR